MRIAVFGATSHIAKDLINLFYSDSAYELVLYARDTDGVLRWQRDQLFENELLTLNLSEFNLEDRFDAILNFIGYGDPEKVKDAGGEIFNITSKYDDLIIKYLTKKIKCRYIFLSSGAAFGGDFNSPVDINSMATININHLKPQDWYGVSKLYAECRHRALSSLRITDLRIFSYFSHTQNLSSRFLMSEILRSILENKVFKTTKDTVMRDYIHVSDLYNLVKLLLNSGGYNGAIDCYSACPIDKISLLHELSNRFGLSYEFLNDIDLVNSTGTKKNYFSKNTTAQFFGYTPAYSSLDGIIREVELAIGK